MSKRNAEGDVVTEVELPVGKEKKEKKEKDKKEKKANADKEGGGAAKDKKRQKR